MRATGASSLSALEGECVSVKETQKVRTRGRKDSQSSSRERTDCLFKIQHNAEVCERVLINLFQMLKDAS